MPELPEVETIKRDLEKTIIGKHIEQVSVFKEKIIKSPDLTTFRIGLVGHTVKDILRRGKYLILRLEKDSFLVIHLKLTGQIIYGDRGKGDMLRLVIGFLRDRYLNLYDQRGFAEVKLVDDYKRLSPIQNMGPEPLSPHFTLEKFRLMLKDKKKAIKPLLMDQYFIAGIGNLYSAEILFRSRIHPERIADSLTRGEVAVLYDAIKSVLQEGIRYRGSSVDTYLDAYGKKGRFTERIKVYSREGSPCPVCNKAIVGIKQAGRTTYFCPDCQR